MSARSLTPATRRLLVHAIECGGAWLLEDPVRVTPQTLIAAEARGLMLCEWSRGQIVCATITAKGRAEMRWFASTAPIELTAPGPR